jgi:hypothetical protein
MVNPHISDNQKVVIGIGPGRCGSKTVAHILSKQRYSSGTHEHPPKLPYKKDMYVFEDHLDALDQKFGHCKYLCLNAFFYTWYLDELFQMYPNARCYCLTRDKASWSQSYFYKLTKRSNTGTTLLYKNFWNSRDRKRCKSDWDVCFPDFPGRQDLRSTIEKFYDWYYKFVKQFEKRYPGQIKYYSVEDLNSRSNLNEFLNYVGIDYKDRMFPESRVQLIHRWYEIKGDGEVKFVPGVKNED